MFLKEQYNWEGDGELPEWLDSDKNRLLLIKELLDEVEPIKTYAVEFTETLSRVVNIEADNEEDALQIARARYGEEEIVLDANDYQGYEIDIY